MLFHLLVTRPDIDFFGHLIDAKRDRDVVTVVATPFQRVCYSFINEDELNHLSVDAHITTCRFVSLA